MIIHRSWKNLFFFSFSWHIISCCIPFFQISLSITSDLYIMMVRVVSTTLFYTGTDPHVESYALPPSRFLSWIIESNQLHIFQLTAHSVIWPFPRYESYIRLFLTSFNCFHILFHSAFTFFSYSSIVSTYCFTTYPGMPVKKASLVTTQGFILWVNH